MPRSSGPAATQLRRLREIVGVFVRYGFVDVVGRMHLAPYLAFGRRVFFPWRKQGSEGGELTRAQRLRLALQDLGPTFIKLGQALSLRADVLSPELIAELSRLQDEVPPLEPGQAEAAVEAELRRPLHSVFRSFDEAAVAAASIAQVHRATLLAGDQVAVKVRRPGIDSVIESDLAVLGQLARLSERYLIDAEVYRPSNLLGQFARSIRRELDLAREGRTIDRFRQNFASDRTVHFPKVYWDYTTPGVLTLEYVDGIKISDVASAGPGYDARLVARRGADAVLKMVLLHGVFHADPHPANVFVLPGNIICFLDFGNAGRIEPAMRETLAKVVSAIVRHDAERLADALLAIGRPLGDLNTQEFKQDIAEMLDNYGGITLRDLSISELLRDAFSAMSRHRLQFPSDLLLLIKAFVTTEGVGRRLDPSFKLIQHARPLVERVLRERLSPHSVASRISDLGHDAAEALQTIPRDLMDIVRRVRTDRLQIQFVHRNLEHFVQEMDRASNRLSFAVVIAALIVGSSFIFQSSAGPHIFGYPALGLGGYLFAAVLGIWLAIGILRSGRL
ncbi:MAG: ubiquinone biosynthesis protein UbiB [Dehalococcoidia bacterium]|nr:ubiquinone biosynthesis protein UbiB [Dehalococcoidia bacterium]